MDSLLFLSKNITFFFIRQPPHVCPKSGDQGCPAVVIFLHTRTQKYFLLPHCSLYRGRHRCRIATGVATCYIESSDKKYYNLPYHTKLSHTIGAARFKHGMVIFTFHTLNYRISRPVRRTMIFLLEILEKNNECILILVIYWKKTGLLHTKISNHNIIYSS